MTSDDTDWRKTKVMRYTGLTEKQSIQWDYYGEPLYSSGFFYKYLSENRNLDICVADRGARAIVVVNAAGKLRFRYTCPPSTPRETFYPVSITTDSQERPDIWPLQPPYPHHRPGWTLPPLYPQLWFTAAMGFMCGLQRQPLCG